MANTVEVNVVENGPRNVILQVYLRSDGASGDLDAYVLVDPVADLGMLKEARLRLSRIEYNFSGFDAVISFGSGLVTPNYKWVLTEGTNCPVDFKDWNFIFDNSGLDGTEKLQISTTGFDNSTDQGSILILLVK